MKNFADRGGCYRPRWITHSEICRILHILRKLNSIILCFHSREKAEIKMKTFQYRQPRIWEMKEDKYTKSLAKNQVCAMVHLRDIRENVLPKFIKLCMETPCLCSFQGHKYGRQKPTETSVLEFSYLCLNSSLEELITIKAIFILRQGMFR